MTSGHIEEEGGGSGGGHRCALFREKGSKVDVDQGGEGGEGKAEISRGWVVGREEDLVNVEVNEVVDCESHGSRRWERSSCDPCVGGE